MTEQSVRSALHPLQNAITEPIAEHPGWIVVSVSCVRCHSSHMVTIVKDADDLAILTDDPFCQCCRWSGSKRSIAPRTVRRHRQRTAPARA